MGSGARPTSPTRPFESSSETSLEAAIASCNNLRVHGDEVSAGMSAMAPSERRRPAPSQTLEVLRQRRARRLSALLIRLQVYLKRGDRSANTSFVVGRATA